MTSTAPQTELERRRSMLGVPVDEQLRLYPNKVPVLTCGQAAKAQAVIAADRKRNREANGDSNYRRDMIDSRLSVVLPRRPMENEMNSASEQGVLNGQWNAAEAAFQAEIARTQPHVLMRPAIFPEGNMWCALYGKDLQLGVCGFGETPELACEDFDKNWRSQRLQQPRPADRKD